MVIPAVAAGAMAAVGFIGPMFVHSIFSIIIGSSPLAEATRQNFNKKWPINIPPVPDLVHQRLLGVIDADGYAGMMLRHGYDADQQARVFAGAEQLLDASRLVFANFRGIIEDGKYEAEMQRMGFSAESLAAFKEVSRYFPAMPDLVTFAVREVYTPDIRKDYGLDEDWPEKFGQEAAKLGVDEEQARNFWASHWILPSIQMGYEMLHRGVITKDQLSTLLKTQDIMPFWREPLIQISYRTLTRVDVRRMYRVGVLDRDGVLRAYKDFGYDDERAEMMTDFTILYETEDEKGLSVTEILRGYERHIISREDAIEWIMLSGYNNEIAEIKVVILEAKMTQDETDDKIDLLEEQYVAGLIVKTELEDELGLMELPPEQVNSIIWRADRAKQRAIRMPSVSDVQRWVDEGLISRDDGLEALRKMNIPEDFVALYLGERKRLPSIGDIRRWHRQGTIDTGQAGDLLTELRVPPEFIQYYLAEPEKVPSPGVIKGWVKGGLITSSRGEELLALQRIPEEFIPLYLEEKLKEPTLKDVQVWLSEGYIDESKAKKILTQLDIPSDLHDFYIKERMRIPTISDVKKWYKNKFVDRPRAVQLLTSLNVRPEFIELYLMEAEGVEEEEE